MISRICEEFGCIPSQALEEPAQAVMDIIELRAYARAKATLEAAKSEMEVERTPMVEMVWVVMHEIKQRRERRKREHGLSG